MNEVISKTNLVYSINGKHIVLTKKGSADIKDIVVSGQVLKISKDAFNSIYLDLKGGTNQFITP